MKKITSFILSIVLCNTVLSQEFSIMPAAGINAGNLSVSDEYESLIGESSSIIRGSFGLEGSLLFNEKITLNLGVYYAARGSTFKNINPDIDFIGGGGFGFPGFGTFPQPEIELSAQIRINYIHFPVTAGYRFELNDQIFIEPQFGFYYSYGTGGEVDIEGSVSILVLGNLPLDQTQPVNFEDDFSRNDMGLLGGVSFEIHNFFLRYQYHYGLKNIAQTGAQNTDEEAIPDFNNFLDDDFKTKWRLSAVHLGYRIRF